MYSQDSSPEPELGKSFSDIYAAVASSQWRDQMKDIYGNNSLFDFFVPDVPFSESFAGRFLREMSERLSKGAKSAIVDQPRDQGINMEWNSSFLPYWTALLKPTLRLRWFFNVDPPFHLNKLYMPSSGWTMLSEATDDVVIIRHTNGSQVVFSDEFSMMDTLIEIDNDNNPRRSSSATVIRVMTPPPCRGIEPIIESIRSPLMKQGSNFTVWVRLDDIMASFSRPENENGLYGIADIGDIDQEDAAIIKSMQTTTTSLLQRIGSQERRPQEQHDKKGQRTAPPKKEKVACTFFQQGRCTRGSACRFSHEL
jgi:hypothetical protein